MSLNKLIAVAGLAGTLGVAAPALADDCHHQVVYQPAPVYQPIARPVYGGYAQPGYYGEVYANNGYANNGYGYGYRPVYRPGWEWRRWEWRRHHHWHRGW